MWSLIPRPRPPVADATTCRCPCHADGYENVAPINGLVTPGVARVDPIAAATACARCLHFHAVALSGRPPELGYAPKPKVPEAPAAPWVDPPARTFYPPQADGGDGDE